MLLPSFEFQARVVNGSTPRAAPGATPDKGKIMRLGSIILVIWLIIGAIAGGQRGYYKNTPNCGGAGTIAVTILAGPLNYAGLNPKVACRS
jgi:hypothetical protein